IASEEEIMRQQGKYPVIRISLKEINESNYKQIIEKLKTKIAELFDEHRYLLLSSLIPEDKKSLYKNYLTESANVSQLENSLKFLSGLLYDHYDKKVYILIDEYDAPI